MALGDDMPGRMHGARRCRSPSATRRLARRPGRSRRLSRLVVHDARRAGDRARARGRGRRHACTWWPHGRPAGASDRFDRWCAAALEPGTGDLGIVRAQTLSLVPFGAAARTHRRGQARHPDRRSGGRSAHRGAGGNLHGARCWVCACSAPTWSSTASARTSGWPRRRRVEPARAVRRPRAVAHPDLLRQVFDDVSAQRGDEAVGPAEPRHALRRGHGPVRRSPASQLFLRRTPAYVRLRRGAGPAAWRPRAQPGSDVVARAASRSARGSVRTAALSSSWTRTHSAAAGHRSRGRLA